MITSNYKGDLVNIVKDFIVLLHSQINNKELDLKATLPSQLDAFTKAMKLSTGITIFVSMSGNLNNLNLGIGSRVTLIGTGSTRYTESKALKQAVIKVNELPDMFDMQVDLTKLKVTGSILKHQNHTLFLPFGFFNPRFGFTIDEVVAGILHEVGHAFSFYTTMGDCAMLNRYLTEGIEVMQGKAIAKTKVEVYSEAWVTKNLTPEEIGDFVYGKVNPTEALRVALLASSRLPRHHIVNSSYTSMAREEQFADLFASRLGYGKHMASLNYKCLKLYGATIGETGWTRQLCNVISVVASLPFLPLVLMFAFTEQLPSEHLLDFEARYDNDKERLIKLRRDLIAQLKQSDNDHVKLTQIEDIKAIDEMILKVHDGKSLYNSLVNVLRPSIRKSKQNRDKEEILESLVNNDLFVNSFLLNQHKHA